MTDLAAGGHPDHDLAVIGDGPAGSALAAAALALGIDVVLIGEDRPWRATYGLWVDEIEQLAVAASLGPAMFSSVVPGVSVFGRRRHRIDRRYGLMDNDAVRAQFRLGLPTVTGSVTGLRVAADSVEVLVGGDSLSARWVVDATGVGSAATGAAATTGPRTAWQTAYGVVLGTVPAGSAIETGGVTLMDFRPPPIHHGGTLAAPTFCYAVPVHDGWLVEETVLSAAPAVPPEQLTERLVARLGGDPAVLDSALRVETVRIPMNATPAPRRARVTAFGAAGGYVHPATGYSVTASLRAAERVAAALGRAIEGGPDPMRTVWTRSMRTTRLFHRYGAAVLAALDQRGIAEFFDLFFERPVSRWSPYLRIDASPRAVTTMMATMFRDAPWSVRRSLLAVDPRDWIRGS